MWNSVLGMKNNNDLIIGEKFHVTITQANGKRSEFKAKTISKNTFHSFAAKQTIMGGWFFRATHNFIIKEVDSNHVIFTQHWQLKGIISKLFKKQIYKELGTFNT